MSDIAEDRAGLGSTPVGTEGGEVGAVVEVAVVVPEPEAETSESSVCSLCDPGARDWSCERVILETTSAWTEIIEFYVAVGFELTGTRTGEFGEDTWFELVL